MSAARRAPLELAILISGRGSNMAAIVRACQAGQINARVRVVISDRPEAGGLATARDLGVEALTIPWQGAAGREAFELALAGAIEARGADLIVLAGFMRVLSGQFVDRYAGRILNIHPSLLPKYTGLHTHRRVLDANETQHGASVHFVTAELDGGPVVLQSIVPVNPDDTEADLLARVQATEYSIYPRVIGLMSDGRLVWDQGRVLLDGRVLDTPLQEKTGARAPG